MSVLRNTKRVFCVLKGVCEALTPHSVHILNLYSCNSNNIIIGERFDSLMQFTNVIAFDSILAKRFPEIK